MNCEYTGILKYLYDWQTIVAGVFALVAGYMAYAAGHEQARLVEQQNTHLQQGDRRRLARSSLVSVRLLDGALAGIEAYINAEVAFIGTTTGITERDGQNVIADHAAASRNRIKIPELSLIWDQLGNMNPEWIGNYMSLHREVLRLTGPGQRQNLKLNSMLDEYRSALAIVDWLRRELECEAGKANATLAEAG